MAADATTDLGKAATEHRKTVESLTRLMSDFELVLKGPRRETMSRLCRQARVARQQARDLETAVKEAAK